MGHRVRVGVAVRLGTADAVVLAVVVDGATAGTVGRAVKVDVELGVGLATAGETAETDVGVGATPHPETVLEMIANSSNAKVDIVLLLLGHCRVEQFDWVECLDGHVLICTSVITFPHRKFQRWFPKDRHWRSAR